MAGAHLSMYQSDRLNKSVTLYSLILFLVVIPIMIGRETGMVMRLHLGMMNEVYNRRDF